MESWLIIAVLFCRSYWHLLTMMNLFVAITLLLYTASQKRISKIPTFLGVTRANIQLSLYLAKNITEKFSNQRPPVKTQKYHISLKCSISALRYFSQKQSMWFSSALYFWTQCFFAAPAGLCWMHNAVMCHFLKNKNFFCYVFDSR